MSQARGLSSQRPHMKHMLKTTSHLAIRTSQRFVFEYRESGTQFIMLTQCTIFTQQSFFFQQRFHATCVYSMSHFAQLQKTYGNYSRESCYRTTLPNLYFMQQVFMRQTFCTTDVLRYKAWRSCFCVTCSDNLAAKLSQKLWLHNAAHSDA